MRKTAIRYFFAFGIVTIASGLLATFLVGLAQQFAFSVFSAALSVTMAIAIVNVILDQKSRRLAAGPLARLVALPITDHHNSQITWGREKFGTADFNALITKYEANGHNPIAFSPVERDQIDEMIDANIGDIEDQHNLIEERLREMIGVLGWSFDARIIAAALTCQQNIAEFNQNNPPIDDETKLKRIEMYIDIDSSATAALEFLVGVLGEQMAMSDRPIQS